MQAFTFKSMRITAVKSHLCVTHWHQRGIVFCSFYDAVLLVEGFNILLRADDQRHSNDLPVFALHLGKKDDFVCC